MPKYDIVAQVVARPRSTGATNSIAAPDQAVQTAALQAQATGQFVTYADAAGTTRVRVGLLASGNYGLALYNAAGALVREDSVPP